MYLMYKFVIEYNVRVIFEKGRINWQKVSQEYNEMGAIVSGVGGEGEINLSEDFKNYI